MSSSSPRHIGINLLFLIPGQVGGTERYARSLLSELSKVDSHNTYTIFCNQENADTFYFANPNWKIINTGLPAKNRPLRIIYEQMVLPFLVRRHGCDMLHSLGYVGPFFTPGLVHFVTVHDANWLDHPADFSFIERVVLVMLIGLSLKSARTVITDSDFSQQRLQHFFPKLPITVIWPWLEESFLNSVQKRKQIGALENNVNSYFLCVSALYPHKNIPYLLKLWSLAKKPSGVTLLLIGKNGRDENEVVERVAELDDVQHLARVSEERLIDAFTNCLGLLAPSIYEGFGYPVYEAVALDKPVLVGSIDPYHPGLKSQLEYVLTGNEREDTEILESFIGAVENMSSKVAVKASKYHFNFAQLRHQSIEQLLGLYGHVEIKNG